MSCLYRPSDLFLRKTDRIAVLKWNSGHKNGVLLMPFATQKSFVKLDEQVCVGL